MTPRLNVRRLAAVDMYGSAGARWRRWVILAEVLFGVIGTAVLGVLLLSNRSGVGPTLAAAWLFGVSANYLPIAWHALSLIRPGALEAELAGVDLRAELRHYTGAQLWLFVPVLVLVLAVRQRKHETGKR